MRRLPPLPGRHGQRKHRRASQLLSLERLEERLLLAQIGITVTTTSDSGPGTTLRNAIIAANGNTSGVPTPIDFAIAAAATATTSGNGSVSAITLTSGGGGYTTAPTVTISPPLFGGTTAAATATVSGGVVTGITITNPGSGYFSTTPTVILTPGTEPFIIHPTSALPTITAPVFIDGTSQSGYAGAPIIVLDGTLAGANVNGLQIGAAAGGSTIEALAIDDFSAAGISVGSASDQLLGNYIGVDATGATAAPNGTGIFIGSFFDTVGGATAADRNVISGNTGNGISVTSSSGTIVTNNYIGTDSSGTIAVPNGGDGVNVSISGGTVGLTTSIMGNVISGNTSNGISIAAGTGNLVQGNDIGTNAAGTSKLANGVDGVLIASGGNTVGGTTAATRNIISGNGLDGVSLTDGGANNNLVEGNYIGTDVTGTFALGNAPRRLDHRHQQHQQSDRHAQYHRRVRVRRGECHLGQWRVRPRDLRPERRWNREPGRGQLHRD